MSAGINGTETRITSWAEWLDWSIRRQMDDWKTSLKREPFYDHHERDMKARNPRYVPWWKRAQWQPRDEYGHKSAGR